MSADEKNLSKDSTLAALLREKPKRGRPRSKVSRQSVYVALSAEQKTRIGTLVDQLPRSFSRADIPDTAIALLSSRFEGLRTAMADRDRELPEGVTDLQSLYYLWDIPISEPPIATKWTSIRLSPQQVVQFGRLQGTLNALFGANRSQVFTLALDLLSNYLEGVDATRQSWQDVPDLELFLAQQSW